MQYRHIKILGYISVLSYLSCVLVIWISANIRGYVYFQGGEPLWWIKYPEWVLGALGVVVVSIELIKEIVELSRPDKEMWTAPVACLEVEELCN